MIEQPYEQLIAAGIKGLHQDALAEITDFIYFVRKRLTQPEAFADEMYGQMLSQELQHLSHAQLAEAGGQSFMFQQQFSRRSCISLSEIRLAHHCRKQKIT